MGPIDFFVCNLWKMKNHDGVKTFGIQLRQWCKSKTFASQGIGLISSKSTIPRIENAKYSAIDTLLSSSQRFDLPLMNIPT
jgi:hypothetical protein